MSMFKSKRLVFVNANLNLSHFQIDNHSVTLSAYKPSTRSGKNLWSIYIENKQ